MRILNVVIVLGALLTAGPAMGSEPLAEVNGKAITAAEVEKSLGGKLAKLQEQMYNLKRDRLVLGGVVWAGRPKRQNHYGVLS